MIKIFSKIAEFFGGNKQGDTSAVILCAGSSTRFSSEGESKQMAYVNGVSVVERTIRSFDECKSVSEIIVVVPKDEAEGYKDFVYEKGFKKVKCIVTGGETRQISALRGFKHVDEKADYIAIHDGARCLITPEQIEEVIEESRKYQIAAAGCKNTDTIKVVDEEGFVVKTLDRDYIWNIQTPQIFECKKYQISAYKAVQDEFSATDDCMLAEHAGFKVKLVNIGPDNIKITVKEDIFRAEAILFQRGEEKI